MLKSLFARVQLLNRASRGQFRVNTMRADADTSRSSAFG